VKKAFEILLADSKVKSIFINIFGGISPLPIHCLLSLVNLITGIMRCDYIAEGVIKATKELSLSIPLIVRLKGTKEAEAKQYVEPLSYLQISADGMALRMIKESGLKIYAFDSLDDAAEQAVQLAL
jgi:succinyl-CoA synthetase beta subunit